MDTIVVSKEKLITTLKANKREHHAIYERAVEVYRRKAIEELERNIAEARNGGVIRRTLSLPIPEDHTHDFTTAIEMLTWDTSDEVELTIREFNQYVQNEWSWAQSFAANSIGYTVAG